MTPSVAAPGVTHPSDATENQTVTLIEMFTRVWIYCAISLRLVSSLQLSPLNYYRGTTQIVVAIIDNLCARVQSRRTVLADCVSHRE